MVADWHISTVTLWSFYANATRTMKPAIPLLSTFVSSSTCLIEAVWPWPSCTCLLRLWRTEKTRSSGFTALDLQHLHRYLCYFPARAGTGSFGGLWPRVNVPRTGGRLKGSILQPFFPSFYPVLEKQHLPHSEANIPSWSSCLFCPCPGEAGAALWAWASCSCASDLWKTEAPSLSKKYFW